MERIKPYRTSMILCGFTTGLLAGLVSSELYTLGLGLLGIRDFNLPGFLFVIIFGQFYGVLPATLIGTLLGTILGLIFKFLSKRISISLGAIIGAILSGILGAILVGIVAFIKSQSLPTDYYWEPPMLFFLSPKEWNLDTIPFTIPILVFYISSGAWCGTELTKCKRYLDRDGQLA